VRGKNIQNREKQHNGGGGRQKNLQKGVWKKSGCMKQQRSCSELGAILRGGKQSTRRWTSATAKGSPQGRKALSGRTVERAASCSTRSSNKCHGWKSRAMGEGTGDCQHRGSKIPASVFISAWQKGGQSYPSSDESGKGEKKKKIGRRPGREGRKGLSKGPQLRATGIRWGCLVPLSVEKKK